MNSLLPMVHPDDLLLDGWDISSMNLADSMERARVLDYNLQKQLRPYMKDMKPRPSVYFPDFIAANQVGYIVVYYIIDTLTIIMLTVNKLNNTLKQKNGTRLNSEMANIFEFLWNMINPHFFQWEVRGLKKFLWNRLQEISTYYYLGQRCPPRGPRPHFVRSTQYLE